MNIIKKAEKFYCKEIEKCHLADLHKEHAKEFNKLVDMVIKKFVNVDEETIRLSVWLHDIGIAQEINKEIEDHAIMGEEMAKEWLIKEGYDRKKMEKILHCVRAHRCKDLQPQTIEAKLVAFIDSASHMTQGIYINYLREGENPLEKLERDWRDLALFPEMRDDFKDLYEAWKELIKSYQKINAK